MSEIRLKHLILIFDSSVDSEKSGIILDATAHLMVQTFEDVVPGTVKRYTCRLKRINIYFSYINVNLKVNKYNRTFCAVHSRNKHDVIWFWL